jgi:hypothetical protein
MRDAPPPGSGPKDVCLARLHEMDAALARMELELPEDVRAVGAEARRRVHDCLHRLGSGADPDLRALTDAVHEISRMMDALTARLLLVPWDGHPRAGPLKS